MTIISLVQSDYINKLSWLQLTDIDIIITSPTHISSSTKRLTTPALITRWIRLFEPSHKKDIVQHTSGSMLGLSE